MEADKRTAGIFFAGIALSTVVISPDVLDLTLTARFISLTFFVFLTFWTLHRAVPELKFRVDLLTGSYGLYTLFCCASILWANTTSEALFESAKVLAGFAVFLLGIFFLRNDEDLLMSRLLKCSILLFFAELVLVIIQLGELSDLDKASLYAVSGMNGHKNLLSSFLLLQLFFHVKALRRLNKPWNWLAALAILLNLAILFLLQTKAVWLGLLIAALSFSLLHIFVVLRKKTRWKLNVYVLIAVLMLAGNLFFLKVLPTLIDKGLSYNNEVKIPGVNTSERELDDERLTLWQKTYVIFRDHPAQGVGMGNWQIAYPKAGLEHLWRAEELNYTFQRPHNDWLWILSETGLTGFNLFLLLLVGLLAFLLKSAIAVADNRSLRSAPLWTIAILAAYFSAAFFDFPRERIEHSIWLNLILAIAYHQIKQYNTLPAFFAFNPRRIHYLGASALFLFMAYVGVLRHQGEFSTRAMYAYKGRGNREQVLSRCKAAESFAYSIDPTSVPICWYSGNAKASGGDYEGAHADLLKAWRLAPYNRNVLNDLASSYAMRQEPELAKTYYREAARISPRFDEPKLNLAAIYIREGNFKMAQSWLNSLVHPSERRSNYEAIVKAGLNQ